MKTKFEQAQDFDVGISQDSIGGVILDQEQTIDVLFSTDADMTVEITEESPFECDFGTSVSGGDYSGPYEVTPSTSRQVLATTNKTLSQNVVIKPIPSNYGLITWNGSTLTVS